MAEFRISTNITRDADANINYIVTKNSNDVYGRIIHNYLRGQHSFSIIGSYGTGKSTFLWAFEKHLTGNLKFAKPINGELKGNKSFQFTRIVGETHSFKQRFCDSFGLAKHVDSSNKKILKEFDALVEEINSQKATLVILVDEFGKYLEYIAKQNPDEMYFIQELAEYCNDLNKKVIFITTLHQNFSAYSKGLNKAERSEWDKVRGRFIDIAFDEPVEQLLFFAAERLKSHSVPSNFKKQYDTGVKNILKANLLGKTLSLGKDSLEHLYPLDPLSADILTKSLQRYGQNERSLFTFLESPELNNKLDNKEVFSVSDCFDYLIQNLLTEIEDGEKNPFKPQWKAAVVALERAEFLFDSNYQDAANILKTICLVNIFSNAVGSLGNESLSNYAKCFLKVSNPEDIIERLIDKKVIKYSNHRAKYNFIEGTDVDIEQELIDAAKNVEADFDLISRIENYFNFSIIPAKKIQYELGTPRFFAFKFYSEIPSDLEKPTAEIDGYINLIFTRNKIETKLQEYANKQTANQIFVLFKEIDLIKDTIFEIDKINFVIGKYSDDKVALRILNEEKLFRTHQLNELVEGALFSKTSNVKWIYNSKIEERKILSYKSLNRLLSDACEISFPYTPRFLNEMVNKEFLSTPILTARKALIKRMIDAGDQLDIGFEAKEYPPEKTIYLSLIKNTGIHKVNDASAYYDEPKDKTFLPIWKKSNELLIQSSASRIPVSKFFSEFKNGKFKLKQGFLDFWVPIFLIIKKEEYSLYDDNGEFIPMLTSEIMDLVYKQPSKYYIKGLINQGVSADYLKFYQDLVDYNQSNIKGLKSSYISIYGNFLRFYRGLDEYTQKTKNLSPQAIGVRNAIANAKDPETALNSSIPEALGYFGAVIEKKKLINFLNDLKNAIREIRSAYDNLIDGVEQEIITHMNLECTNFDEFKDDFTTRFSGINKNLILNDKLKNFYTRLMSPLDVKRAYWESLCDVVLGKKLDKITDDEIQIFIDRLKSSINSLTDLIPLHKDSNTIDAEVLQISIIDATGSDAIKKNIVQNAKNNKKVGELEKKIESILTSDLEVNKLALIQALKNILLK